ncbi:DEAD/DEAH box helicase [Persicobacter sp. CCB-QB2]|uniref:DEAD/DEAH box helicase n=1 Tax=Persicobacter sp. CCB-QB2 TaxID=1561025 RepID=UPI0006A9F518|nr:SNF2-related protein [Persicobacter sp. CCB-QB2]
MFEYNKETDQYYISLDLPQRQFNYEYRLHFGYEGIQERFLCLNSEVDDQKVVFVLREHKTAGKYQLNFNALPREGKVAVKCSCGATPNGCEHIYVAMKSVLESYDYYGDIFEHMFDWAKIENLRNEEKIEQILDRAEYPAGRTYEDDFEVKMHYGELALIPKDQRLLLNATDKQESWKQGYRIQQAPTDYLRAKKSLEQQGERGFAMVWANYSRDDWRIPLLFGLSGKVLKNGTLGTPFLTFDDQYTPHFFKELTRPAELMLSSFCLRLKEELLEMPMKEGTRLNFAKTEIMAHWEEIIKYPAFLASGSPSYGKIAKTKLQSVSYGNIEDSFFRLEKEGEFIVLYPVVVVEGVPYFGKDLLFFTYGFARCGDILVPVEKRLFDLVLSFHNPEGIKCYPEVFEKLKQDLLPRIQAEFRLENHLEEEVFVAQEAETLKLAGKRLYILEYEDHLIFEPAVLYSVDGQLKEYKCGELSNEAVKRRKDGQGIFVRRDEEGEKLFWEEIQATHPHFEKQQADVFYLSFEQAMSNMWFLDAHAQWQEAGIEVLGQEKLKGFKYSMHRPKVWMSAGQSKDWFDLKMEVSFGEEKVKLSDIRKALQKNEDFVKLSNGEKGVLPQEWLEKYKKLLLSGKISKDNVRISQFQPTLIDQLYEEVENSDFFDEYRQKIEKLRNFEKMPALPRKIKGLKADLRPYQKEGLRWMRFLHEIGWGGCLADDMGLGKTVQVLSLLASVHKAKSTSLIIVPRSLIFNWQKEVEKFCPEMKVLNYAVADRKPLQKEMKQYQLVLATYATVRQDIEFLKSQRFFYVILDESQAIKNPTTQTAKAMKLLKSSHRLVMTGTPVENNTLDLYSQMDFLNPGMLGSLEHFRNEYARKIDVDRDQEAAENLRKIVGPFMLRRKKADVATDLPAKSETVVYCEMGAEQRKVYDYHKDKWRTDILETIETEGKAKAGIKIVQGLLKLRQICNSPALLSDGDYGKESVKMEMLLEQISEIINEGHKVLIFSFFVEMLEMVNDRLKTDLSIKTQMLTGASKDRQKLVEDFKSDEDCMAFLISLKAGGFGLNLTEASYVFLIDPWWNPAVEQQAIDRTHRIGQDKNVFAYRFICKDSIEEKILEIQETKSAVADDVVSVETGFVKKLDKQQIEQLFQ